MRCDPAGDELRVAETLAPKEIGSGVEIHRPPLRITRATGRIAHSHLEIGTTNLLIVVGTRQELGADGETRGCACRDHKSLFCARAPTGYLRRDGLNQGMVAAIRNCQNRDWPIVSGSTACKCGENFAAAGDLELVMDLQRRGCCCGHKQCLQGWRR